MKLNVFPKLPAHLPKAHHRQSHPDSEDKNPLDLHDHVLDNSGLQRTGSNSSQGPTNNFFGRWPDGIRGNVIAMLAEFIGTTTFLFFGFAAAQVANEKSDSLNLGPSTGPSLLQIGFISATFGMSLAVNVWIFYRVSGGMFNPAVALGLWVAGAFNWIRLICVVPAQIAGGIAAAGLVSGVFPNELQASNTLSDNTTPAQGFFIEAMLTGELVMTIIMLAVVKSRTSFMAPLAIGLALFIGHLIGINFTGASMNPARTIGPALISKTFPGYLWIYFTAPFVGALAAAGLYHLLKAMAYWTANPDQDADGLEYYRVISATIPPDQQPSHGMRRKSDTSDLSDAGMDENHLQLHRTMSPSSSFYV